MVQPVIHATWETDVGESQVQVQPELQSSRGHPW